METRTSEELKMLKLLEFKNYVHKRLDEMGVPADPEPEKNAITGCRIEGRLNFVEKMMSPPINVDYLYMVKQFHLLFQHPVLNTPQIPDETRRGLRIGLIMEEATEFAEAVQRKDIVAVADALCDLQYVLAGAVLEFGLHQVFPLMFAEVQRSNMSKACNSLDEANRTIAAQEGSGTYYVSERGGKYFVYRDDKKTIKSINYSPANLQQFL